MAFEVVYKLGTQELKIKKIDEAEFVKYLFIVPVHYFIFSNEIMFHQNV